MRRPAALSLISLSSHRDIHEGTRALLHTLVYTHTYTHTSAHARGHRAWISGLNSPETRCAEHALRAELWVVISRPYTLEVITLGSPGPSSAGHACAQPSLASPLFCFHSINRGGSANTTPLLGFDNNTASFVRERRARTSKDPPAVCKALVLLGESWHIVRVSDTKIAWRVLNMNVWS